MKQWFKTILLVQYNFAYKKKKKRVVKVLTLIESDSNKLKFLVGLLEDVQWFILVYILNRYVTTDAQNKAAALRYY